MQIDKKKLKKIMEERVIACINYDYKTINHRDDTDAMFLSGYCMYESSKIIEKLTSLHPWQLLLIILIREFMDNLGIRDIGGWVGVHFLK